ncbi:phosphoribosyl-AMP cyclohydrolase [Spiribacter insolitus]|uniref:Phosphoribosyl-AMP cyclohydrolase n=1 Tax=Spiribacter insolitus TaxID=3122417 RepID=A0ABV3TBX8_9GAMM
MSWLDEVAWNADGLVPVIAQDVDDGRVLMMAWMNRQALESTLTTGEAVYWSRSRQRPWHKGESSGNVQRVRGIAMDCDGDTLLLQVQQVGGVACHTGRRSCFYRRLDDGQWRVVESVRKDPAAMYGGSNSER